MPGSERTEGAVPCSEDDVWYAVFQNTDNTGHCLLTSENSCLDTAATSTTAKFSSSPQSCTRGREERTGKVTVLPHTACTLSECGTSPVHVTAGLGPWWFMFQHQKVLGGLTITADTAKMAQKLICASTPDVLARVLPQALAVFL